MSVTRVAVIAVIIGAYALSTWAQENEPVRNAAQQSQFEYWVVTDFKAAFPTVLTPASGEYRKLDSPVVSKYIEDCLNEAGGLGWRLVTKTNERFIFERAK